MFQIYDYYTPMIRMISEALVKRANIILKEYGVTSSQAPVLSVLSTMENNECTLKELEKVFSYSQAAIAATALRLEARGFVESFVKEDDKRIKYVRLTQKGETVVKAAQEKIFEMQEELIADFTEEEKTMFMFCLRRLRKKLLNT